MKLKILKRIAAIVLAALTLAITMVSASAYEVNSSHINKRTVKDGLPDPKFGGGVSFMSYYDITKDTLDRYPMLTFDFLYDHVDRDYRHTEWTDPMRLNLNWHISRGMIICTFEKGMSLTQAWDYARHIQVRDTTGNVTTELIYDVDTGVYALRAFGPKKNIESVNNDKLSFTWDTTFDFDNNGYISRYSGEAHATVCSNLLPQLWIYNRYNGKVKTPMLYENPRWENGNIQTISMVWVIGSDYEVASILQGTYAPDAVPYVGYWSK